MSGAVGLICDVRLGILLTCEFALMTTGTSALSIISLFVAMGMSWIPLRVIRRAPTVLNRGWLFPCTDLVVTSTLVFALSNAFNGAEDLVLAYVLTSALLVGTVTRVDSTWGFRIGGNGISRHGTIRRKKGLGQPGQATGLSVPLTGAATRVAGWMRH